MTDALALARELVAAGLSNIPAAGYVGASDSAAIVGRNPWRKPIDVYLKIVEGIDTPHTPQTQAGLILEPIVAVMFERLTGARLRKCASIIEPFGLRGIRVSPDFEREDEDANVETKTSYSWAASEIWGGEEPPDYVVDQVQVQLQVTGKPRCYVPVMINGALKVFTVERDDAHGEFLLGAMIDFVERHIVPRVMPEVVATETFSQYLRRKFPRDTSPVRDATPTEIALAEDWLRARTLKDETERRCEELAAKIRNTIGDAGGIRGPFGAITYKTDKRERRSLRVAQDNITNRKAA